MDGGQVQIGVQYRKLPGRCSVDSKSRRQEGVLSLKSSAGSPELADTGLKSEQVGSTRKALSILGKWLWANEMPLCQSVGGDAKSNRAARKSPLFSESRKHINVTGCSEHFSHFWELWD